MRTLPLLLALALLAGCDRRVAEELLQVQQSLEIELAAEKELAQNLNEYRRDAEVVKQQVNEELRGKGCARLRELKLGAEELLGGQVSIDGDRVIAAGGPTVFPDVKGQVERWLGKEQKISGEARREELLQKLRELSERVPDATVRWLNLGADSWSGVFRLVDCEPPGKTPPPKPPRRARSLPVQGTFAGAESKRLRANIERIERELEVLDRVTNEVEALQLQKAASIALLKRLRTFHRLKNASELCDALLGKGGPFLEGRLSFTEVSAEVRGKLRPLMRPDAVTSVLGGRFKVTPLASTEGAAFKLEPLAH